MSERRYFSFLLDGFAPQLGVRHLQQGGRTRLEMIGHMNCLLCRFQVYSPGHTRNSCTIGIPNAMELGEILNCDTCNRRYRP